MEYNCSCVDRATLDQMEKYTFKKNKKKKIKIISFSFKCFLPIDINI